MSNYTVTGIPAAQTRASSSQVRGEFVLVSTAVNSKGDLDGQAWTGVHDYTGATSIKVPTPVNGSDAVPKSYADNLVYSTVLPGQSLGFFRSTGTVASFGTTHTGYAQNEVKGVDIAAAATINLTTATGNFGHITGSGSTITAITIPVGAERTEIFDGVNTLVHSASLQLEGLANITTAVGDRMIVRGDTAGAIVISYKRADGRPIITAGIELIATATVGVPVATIDFLATFTSGYDRYTIELSGIKQSASATLQMRLAVAGVADAGTNYTTPNIGTSAQAQSQAQANISNNIGLTTLGGTYTIDVRNANGASTLKTIGVRGTSYDGANYISTLSEGSYYATNVVSGFRLFMSAGNITAGTIRVYGHRNT